MRTHKFSLWGASRGTAAKQLLLLFTLTSFLSYNVSEFIIPNVWGIALATGNIN